MVPRRKFLESLLGLELVQKQFQAKILTLVDYDQGPVIDL
jgi:hypothetical protein